LFLFSPRVVLIRLAVAVFTASKLVNLLLKSPCLATSSHTMGIFGNKQDADGGVGVVVGEVLLLLLLLKIDENLDFFAAGGVDDGDGDGDGDGVDDGDDVPATTFGEFLLRPNTFIILYISNTK
jgi:hypothetical protein